MERAQDSAGLGRHRPALGYERWIAQGGDFGGLISPEIGRVDPAGTLGMHVNALVTGPDWTSADPLAGPVVRTR